MLGSTELSMLLSVPGTTRAWLQKGTVKTLVRMLRIIMSRPFSKLDKV